MQKVDSERKLYSIPRCLVCGSSCIILDDGRDGKGGCPDPRMGRCCGCDQVAGHSGSCMWTEEEIAKVEEDAKKLAAELGGARTSEPWHSGVGGGDDEGYVHPDVLATQTPEFQAKYAERQRTKEDAKKLVAELGDRS